MTPRLTLRLEGGADGIGQLLGASREGHGLDHCVAAGLELESPKDRAGQPNVGSGAQLGESERVAWLLVDRARALEGPVGPAGPAGAARGKTASRPLPGRGDT